MRKKIKSAWRLKEIPSLLLVLLLVVIFTLGACGRKGGLYLPEPKPEVKEQTQSDNSTSSEEDPESEKKNKRQSETQ